MSVGHYTKLTNPLLSAMYIVLAKQSQWKKSKLKWRNKQVDEEEEEVGKNICYRHCGIWNYGVGYFRGKFLSVFFFFFFYFHVHCYYCCRRYRCLIIIVVAAAVC